MEPFIHTAGRMHPMVLHLPIGLLLGLAAWEVVRAMRGRRAPALGAPAVFLAWLAVLGSGGAIATGLAHELELGTDPTTNLHKWLGIAAGVGSFITASLALFAGSAPARPSKPTTPDSASKPLRVGPATTAYRLALFTTVAILLPAGHLGGTITHGEGYLFAPLFQKDPVPDDDLTGPVVPDATGGSTGNARVLAVNAREVLASRCESCHGPTRSRGGIRLDSMSALLTPGDDGPPVVPGDPAASTIIQRMRRPLDARGHMPPPDRDQPTQAEIAAIEAWIVSLGNAAPADPEPAPVTPAAAPVRPQSPESPAPSPGARQVEPPAPGADVPQPTAPDARAIARLREQLVHVQPVAAGSNLLWIDLSTLGGAPDTTVAQLLLPLKDNVAELSLARTGVTDSTLSLVGDMPHLARLDLTGAGITDAGLSRLAGHGRLQTLVLVGTGITDAAAPMLASMESLRSVFVWRTAMTDEGVDWLALVRPDLTVNTGQAGDEPLEVEPAPVIPR